MKPREMIATAKIPGHTAELRCYHHDGDYEVWVDHTELMSSRVFGSEQQLAELTFAALGPRKKPRVLVGGLGMGFTLARVLALASDKATVEVVELVPEVVTWNQEVFGHCAGHPLRDERTQMVLGDVRQTIDAADGIYDAILLDVDNGPEGLSRPGNDSIYNKAGLAKLFRALRPSGILGVWSSADDANFDLRLRRAKFQFDKHRVRARRTKGPSRMIWIARKP